MQTVNVERLGLTEGDRVLDVGCSEGEGNHLQAAYESLPLQAVGVDSNADRLKTFRTRFRRFAATPPSTMRRMNLTSANLLDLPFPARTFDAVICAEVLEHIPDYRRALREIDRVLRPGGHLGISVPRFFPEWVCWVLEEEYHDNPGGHLRIFDADHLRREIESMGFDCYGSHSALALHTPFWWLSCWWWDSKESSRLLEKYNDLLVWDLMEKPWITRGLDALLNPLVGKSRVLYFRRTVRPSASGWPPGKDALDHAG